MKTKEEFKEHFRDWVQKHYWNECRECQQITKGWSYDWCYNCNLKWREKHSIKTPEELLSHQVKTYWQRGWVTTCMLDSKSDITPEWENGFNHAMNTVAFWLDFQKSIDKNPSSIDMWKSALLGRLMRGEQLRLRPCPIHKGIMWCGWGLQEQYVDCGCQETGWLPNEGTPEAELSEAVVSAWREVSEEFEKNPPEKLND